MPQSACILQIGVAPFATALKGEDKLCEVIGTLKDNDHFGAESCVLSVPSPTSFVSRKFCKALTLAGNDLEEIMRLHGPTVSSSESVL